MRVLRAIRSRASDQRGAVLITFALFAPVLVVMMSFVIDIGNVFALQSHLQVQADAGALAATNDFAPCNNSTITADVAKYSGFGSGGPYNQQIDTGTGNQSTIKELINSQTYPGPVPGTPDDTNPAAPCTSNMVDVKISDSNVPWYFNVLGLGPSTINAHARVVVGETTAIPYAVPLQISDPTPRSAAACFVNESNGSILASTPLTATGNTWSNASAPLPVKINVPGIAVRVALSPNASTSCTDPSATVVDTSGGSVGILHIQGWTQNNAGSFATPAVRQVVLTKGSCTDQYFSNPTASCTVGIQANVDYGTTSKPSSATVTAAVGGNTYPLAYVSTNGKTETWSASGLSVPPSNGSNGVSLTIASQNHTETVNNVQRAYTAGSNSGPITAASVSENGTFDEASYRECETGFTACTHNLVVTIAIPALLSGALETLTSNNVVLCPPLWTNFFFTQLVAQGCTANFVLNTGQACTFNSPFNCVYQIPFIDQFLAQWFAYGLNQRILGSYFPSSCTSPNHWSSYPNLPAGDPRLITIFATPFGATSSNNGFITATPIEAFATFYVTGWNPSGGFFGGSNPCQGHGDDTAAPGTVVGHFIHYVNQEGTVVSGPCDPNGINQCTATLTR